jgi:receptor protein-tyrosine kinase
MSKLFEALKRGDDLLSESEMESLLDGSVQVQTDPTPPLAVPDAGSAKAAPKSDIFQGAIASTRMVQLQISPASPILPFDGTHWGAGEQYRLLRTKIRQHPRAPQILVVTSASPSDGKSVTAINLAGALALKGEARVLLVDGDFRRSTICAQLGLPPVPGLAEVLNGDCALHEALIQTEQITNLYILSSGKTVANPAELLDCSLWKTLVQFCRTEFEHIVIDCPPYGCLADYDLIQAVCDGTILVVRPDHTDRQLCLTALSGISKAKLLGVVVNCVEEWFLHKRNKYGYYGYYKKEPGRSS